MKTKITEKEKIHIKLGIRDKITKQIQNITIDIVVDKLGLWKEDLRKIFQEQEGIIEEFTAVIRKEFFTPEGEFLILEERAFMQ